MFGRIGDPGVILTADRLESWDDFVVQQMKTFDDIKTYFMVALEEYEKDGNSEAFLITLDHIAKACKLGLPR